LRSFWRLVGYEYKKILLKKSVTVALLLAIIACVLSVWGTLYGGNYVNGEKYESYYEAMIKDRAYARTLAGREIDSGLIMEASQAFEKIPSRDYYFDAPEYQAFARRYNEIYNISRQMLSTQAHRFNVDDFQTLTEEQAQRFYIVRRDKQVQTVEETGMSRTAKEKMLALDSEIKTPFAFSYTEGYTRFFCIMYTNGLMAAFILAVCIAPIFSGEYATGVDQIILTSKHGKRRIIQAKLFTGFSLSAAIYLVLTLITYSISMLTFGLDGRNAPLQLFYPMSPYPVTMGQTAWMVSVSGFFACLMTAAITMLLSAKLKSAYRVIIPVTLLLVAPTFLSVSSDRIVLYNLFRLLPVQMMNFGSVINIIQYELFGLIFGAYVVLPLFAAAVCILLAPLAYRFFKYHQIT
jgi:ABC-type transport system involved in multi-copper enzyme maturation permease subunit